MSVSTRALVVLGILGLSMPAAAQDWKGMGRMEGKVLDAEGKPIADAVVKLELPGRGSTTLKTDKKGKWAILGVAGGVWNVDIAAPGFTPRRISTPRISEVEHATPPIEVKLAKVVVAGPPPELMAALEKGNEFFKAEKYPEARAEYMKLMSPEYEKIRTANPSLMTTLHKQIAFTYSKEKNYANELEELQKVLDAEPGNTDIRTLMAMEAFEGGMTDKGLELLKGIDESTIKSPDVFFNIGVNFVNKGRQDDAVTYFTKAVTVDPTYVDGYFQRGLAYFGLQKLAECKADFKKVLELSPTGPQAETAKKVLASLK